MNELQEIMRLLQEMASAQKRMATALETLFVGPQPGPVASISILFGSHGSNRS
jgi:hypothetical protein